MGDAQMGLGFFRCGERAVIMENMKNQENTKKTIVL